MSWLYDYGCIRSYEWMTAALNVPSLMLFVEYQVVAGLFWFYVRKRHAPMFRPLFGFLALVFSTCGMTHATVFSSNQWGVYLIEIAVAWVAATAGLLLAITFSRMIPKAVAFPQSGVLAHRYEAFIETTRGLLVQIDEIRKTDGPKADDLLQELHNRVADIQATALR